MNIFNRIALALLISVSLCGMLSCSNERPLYPREDALTDLLHEPYENREAEELALQLSGEFIAPPLLYERISSDLADMRAQWSDSVPSLAERAFVSLFAPGVVRIHLHDELDPLAWSTSTVSFDSLRTEYEFDSLELTDNRVLLRSRFRFNPNFLLAKIERLPGVCWAEVVPQYPESNGAAASGDSIFYLHIISTGFCYGSFCSPSYRAWFMSDASGFRFLGIQRHVRGDTIPDQFKSAFSHGVSYFRGEIPDSIRFRDETPPARAIDLRVIGDQEGRTATIAFTSSGDDGVEGAAYNATVCTSTLVINDENFGTIGSRTNFNPGLSGDERTLTLSNLSGALTNHFAVRFVDCNQNVSRVSNIAESRNIWLNGWTYFNSSNSPMPDDHVSAMLRDSRGRIWIATYNGLVCKEGERWDVFQTSNSGIPYDLITSLAEGPDGSIWVGTPQGLGRFDGVTWETFTRLNSAIPKQEISCVSVSDDGAVWLGYGQYGLVKYDDETWTVFTPSNSPLRGGTVHSIFSDSEGMVWIGTNLGVNRIDGEEWTHYDPSNSGIGGLSGSAFFEDTDGTIWCASSTGAVSWFDGTSWQSHIITGWRAKSIARASGGPMWIGAEGGLWKHDGDNWLGLSGATTGLPSNNCTALIAEDELTLWIGTVDNGLCRWDLQAAKMDVATTVSRLGY